MRLLVLLTLYALLWSGPAPATTIRQAELVEMLENSALVFEGRVIDRQVISGPYGRPVTQVRFQILDILKGTHVSDHLTLPFLGGSLNGRQLQIQDMDYPEVGEHGVYFVESLDHPQAHPLYGWSQGRFRIHRDDAGILRVYDARDRPVTHLEFRGRTGIAGVSRGTAAGVTTSRSAASRDTLPLEEFKQKLRSRVEEQR